MRFVKGQVPWNKGLPKESQPKFGKRWSLQSSKKASRSLKGRVFSEEWRRKLSDSKRGRLRPDFSGAKHPNWIGDGRTIDQRRRQRMKENGGFHYKSEWELLKAQYNWTCLSCGRNEEIITLTKDHIIPVSKGGSDNIENIQPLCGSCNYKKHDKEIKYGND